MEFFTDDTNKKLYKDLGLYDTQPLPQISISPYYKEFIDNKSRSPSQLGSRFFAIDNIKLVRSSIRTEVIRKFKSAYHADIKAPNVNVDSLFERMSDVYTDITFRAGLRVTFDDLIESLPLTDSGPTEEKQVRLDESDITNLPKSLALINNLLIDSISSELILDIYRRYLSIHLHTPGNRGPAGIIKSNPAENLYTKEHKGKNIINYDDWGTVVNPDITKIEIIDE